MLLHPVVTGEIEGTGRVGQELIEPPPLSASSPVRRAALCSWGRQHSRACLPGASLVSLQQVWHQRKSSLPMTGSLRLAFKWD